MRYFTKLAAVAMLLAPAAAQAAVMTVTSTSNGQFGSSQGFTGGTVLSKSDPPEMILQALAAIATGARFISDKVRTLVGPLGEDRLANLTMREREVLLHLAEGGSNDAIAEQLGIDVLTVKKHRQNLMRKLGVSSAVEAARKAYQLGLLILTQHE